MELSTRLESNLRRKLTRFLGSSGRQREAASVLKKWQQLGWNPILFGGIIRDLMVFGSRQHPRDIDVVLGAASIGQVLECATSNNFQVNRFGGLHIDIDRWMFDVWSLDKTWVFTIDDSIRPTPDNLPRTTFLDIEAIAVTLESPNRVGDIFSRGFFEAVESKCISINYQENPFPSLCAVRSVLIAWKLGFKLSPRLAKYFVDIAHSEGSLEFVKAQENHYGKIPLRASEVEELRSHFLEMLSLNTEEPISLPDRFHPKQLEFWPD